MIDTHCHILPGVDDGARNLEESLKMAEKAWTSGVKEIVVTPHGGWVGCPLDHAQVAKLAKDLETELHERGFGLRLHPGMEVYIEPEVPKQLDAGYVVTCNGGPYALIELPRQQYPLYVDEVFFQLQLRGVRLILAHPERNEIIQKDLNILYSLVSHGVIGQLDARCLTGFYGNRVKEVSKKMLEHRLVQLIASDAHWADQYSHLLPAVETAVAIVGQDEARAMVESRPAAIVRGEPIALPDPIPYQQKKIWGLWS